MNPLIVITTTQTLHGEWLAFAAWYSAQRLGLQTAAVFPRSSKSFQIHWMNRMGVSHLNYGADRSEEDAIKSLPERLAERALVMRDTQMLLRQPTDTLDGCAVDCSRLGRFSLEGWIRNERTPPFWRTDEFECEMSRDEREGLSLWEKMRVFEFLNRWN